ncbi:MAG: hypothetical protein QOF01_464 [Thermomicrobiales bacterium]|jgi:AraC family transcriptional regulator|nr:hypothetical protein [Thermomicrobiales bacterium]
METSTLAVERRSYEPERLIHRHDFRQVVFPERGRLELAVEGRVGYVGGSQLAVVDPGIEHTCWATTPTSCLIVELRTDGESSAESPREAAPFRLLDARLAVISWALRVELASDGLADPLIAESLGTYLSASLSAPTTPTARDSFPTPAQRRLAAQAREYVDAHFRDDLTIAEIAAAVCASPAHLQRSFRAGTGVSLIRYVHQLRLRRAADLLRTSNRSVTEVALAVGFADPSYFARLFRREYGVAPASFRVSD